MRCNTRIGGQGTELGWLNAAKKYVLKYWEIVQLSVDDPTAQPLLWEHAQRQRSVDLEFSDDLEQALRNHGFEPPSPAVSKHEALNKAWAKLVAATRSYWLARDVAPPDVVSKAEVEIDAAKKTLLALGADVDALVSQA